MLIDVRNATVATANITIRMLTIGDKQVTLAVFRQLESDAVIDSAGQMAGTVWGRVNYFWKGCAEDTRSRWSDHALGNHLHVVWQKGDELRRDCVEPPTRSLDYYHRMQLRDLEAQRMTMHTDKFSKQQAILAQQWQEDRGVLNAYQTSWAVIVASPQLFIAV